jgi:flagellar protein FliL
MAADPKKAESPAAGSGGKKKLVSMIGVAVALVAISIGGTVVALKMLGPKAPDAAHAEAAAEEAHAAPAIYLELAPNFTINFSVNGRQRFLQAALTLLYRDPELEALIKLHMPAIRNGLVLMLSNKNFDELQSQEGKDAMRIEALEIVQGILDKEIDALVKNDPENKHIPKGKVEQVLFTNFVMQ